VSKFLNFFFINGSYGTLSCAESKSVFEKILKNFLGTLESHKILRHLRTLATTFWYSGGPPIMCTFFGAPGDALSNRLSKKAEMNFLKKVNISSPTHWPIWPSKVDLRLKRSTMYNFSTLYPPTLLPGPKTPHFSKTRYKTLNFSTGRFSAALECGTKMAMRIKLPMADNLLPRFFYFN